MSYSITGTTITLTRGDTFEALVSATKKDGTPFAYRKFIGNSFYPCWRDFGL